MIQQVQGLQVTGGGAERAVGIGNRGQGLTWDGCVKNALLDQIIPSSTEEAAALDKLSAAFDLGRDPRNRTGEELRIAGGHVMTAFKQLELFKRMEYFAAAVAQGQIIIEGDPVSFIDRLIHWGIVGEFIRHVRNSSESALVDRPQGVASLWERFHRVDDPPRALEVTTSTGGASRISGVWDMLYDRQLIPARLSAWRSLKIDHANKLQQGAQLHIVMPAHPEKGVDAFPQEREVPGYPDVHIHVMPIPFFEVQSACMELLAQHGRPNGRR